MEPTNIVVVVIVIIVAFILMSACCRGIRHAYENHLTNEQMVRRRQAFYIAQASRNLQELDDRRAVCVTTISADGDRYALGVYEIRMPQSQRRGANRSALEFQGRRQPSPPPFSTALQVSTPITYIDMDELPPSYDDYLKSQLPTPNDNEIQPPPAEGDKQRF